MLQLNVLTILRELWLQLYQEVPLALTTIVFLALNLQSILKIYYLRLEGQKDSKVNIIKSSENSEMFILAHYIRQSVILLYRAISESLTPALPLPGVELIHGQYIWGGHS